MIEQLMIKQISLNEPASLLAFAEGLSVCWGILSTLQQAVKNSVSPSLPAYPDPHGQPEVRA